MNKIFNAFKSFASIFNLTQEDVLQATDEDLTEAQFRICRVRVLLKHSPMWCIFIISSAAFPQLRKCDIIPRNEDQNEDTEPGGCGLRGMSGEGGVPDIAAQHSAPHRRSCRKFATANIYTICYWSVPLEYSWIEIGLSSLSNHSSQSQRQFCQNVALYMISWGMWG